MHWQQVNSRHTEWKSQQCVKWPEKLWESVSVVRIDQWQHEALWIGALLSSFVVSVFSFLLVSASLDCFSLFRWSHTALAQGPHSSHFHAHVPCVISLCALLWLTRLLHSLIFSWSLTVFLLIDNLFFLRCPGETPCATSAEDLGTLAENEPPTLLWERQFEKILLKHGWEKVFNWECLIRASVNKGYSYLCMWMTSNWLERNKTLFRCGKYLIQEVDLGEPTSFLDDVYLGCTQRQCEISKDIVDNYRTMFESRIFRGENWKTTILDKSSYFFVVLRYGRSCQEMCGMILWVGEQDDSTTLQSIYSMHRWPSLQRERIEIWRRVVKSMLSNCSEMLVFGTCWKILTLCGRWTNLHDRSRNGPEPVTNDYLVWSLTSITHVNINSIDMWVILQNNADWDCFKTPIFAGDLEDSKSTSGGTLCVLGSHTFVMFQQVECARNKLQFHTVQQNQKSSLWMQDWGLTVFPLLISGIWLFQSLETQLRTMIERRDPLFALTRFKNENNL